MMMTVALLVVILALGTALVIWINAQQSRRKRRTSRERRAGDYAQRAVQWRGYLQVGEPNRPRDTTDQRQTDD